jgi:RimJ/RimL family protein N-acetyltransferase
VSRSDPRLGRLSTYTFPEELRVDELLVRAPTDADVDTIAPAFADPAVGGEAGIPPFDPATLRSMLRERLPDMTERGLLAPYLIVDTRSDDILGGLAIHHLDPLRDVVELGYWLLVGARGRGVATRVVEAAVEHAFANGIHRVEAHVRVGNVASERVLERAGFVREGVKRRFLRRHDEGLRYDATLFARLGDDE